MGSFVKHVVICNAYSARQLNTDHHRRRTPKICRSSAASSSPSADGEDGAVSTSRRLAVSATTFLTASTLLSATAAAESWGTRSYIRERYFQPNLSPGDAAARIRQTAEGLRSMRRMLETMSWRYVLFYVRFKMAYLSSDLKNAMAMVPESRRQAYVKTANEVVDNMTELDHFVRTPKVYESYVYYERTLKSLDELVAQLA